MGASPPTRFTRRWPPCSRSVACPARLTPRAWTDDDVIAADVVVTMGCGDTCPFYPGTRYEDWDVTDPSGRSVDEVRRIVDDIEARVRVLLASIGVPTTAS